MSTKPKRTRPPTTIPRAVERDEVGARRLRHQIMSTRARACLEIASGDSVVRPLKMSERVARDVVRDIIHRELHTGDGLPPEAAMLEEYDVSRESLREGLRLLEVQGLIAIRRGPGGGPQVGTVDPANLGRIASLYYHLSGATYEELFESWVFAEGELAERAARNPDAAKRAEAMHPFLEQPDVSAAEAINEYVAGQTRFHAALAALTRNRVLELTLQTFGQIVSHHVAVADDPRHLRDQISHDHHAIAGAVVSGHPVRARQLMEEHIGAVAAYARSRFGDRVHDFIEWQ